MKPGYFDHVRKDVTPLLPATARTILDVGAGAGRTGGWLRSLYPGCRVIALEGDAVNSEELRKNTDEHHIVDLNRELPDIGTPDLILVLDVLEHLTQPDDVLRRLTERLADGGLVILSCPNVAHLSVSVPLLLRGRFDYQDAGILDRTHMRFFVRESALALMNGAGLLVDRGIRIGLTGPRSRLLDIFTLGMLRERLSKQYVLAGRKMRPGERQGGGDVVERLMPHDTFLPDFPIATGGSEGMT